MYSGTRLGPMLCFLLTKRWRKLDSCSATSRSASFPVNSFPVDSYLFCRVELWLPDIGRGLSWWWNLRSGPSSRVKITRKPSNSESAIDPTSYLRHAVDYGNSQSVMKSVKTCWFVTLSPKNLWYFKWVYYEPNRVKSIFMWFELPAVDFYSFDSSGNWRPFLVINESGESK